MCDKRFFFSTNKRYLIAVVLLVPLLAYISGRREGAKKALLEAHFFSEANNVIESHHEELRNIFYLHTPKCGSSFATVLVQYACPSFPRNRSVSGPSSLEFPPGQQMNYTKFCDDRFKRFRSGHAPLPRFGPMFTKENDIVTFVRNPIMRIVSGFLHNFHDCNMTAMAVKFPWIFPNHNPFHLVLDRSAPNYTAIFSDEHDNDLSTVYSFYWNCVEGCASRMILGEKCGKNIMNMRNIIPPSQIKTAIQIMHEFAFVGLTDKWNESMKLWSCMFGGKYSNDVEKNTRPSAHGGYKDALYQLTQNLKLSDEADHLLFLFAESQFAYRLQKYCRTAEVL